MGQGDKETGRQGEEKSVGTRDAEEGTGDAKKGRGTGLTKLRLGFHGFEEEKGEEISNF